MNPAQLANVISLDANERYSHFISKVGDWEELWTLRDPDGFLRFSGDDNQECVPVWNHPDFAALLAVEEWSGAYPERIELSAFLSRWIPGITKDNCKIVVFPTDKAKGIIVTPQNLERDLRLEAEQYE